MQTPRRLLATRVANRHQHIGAVVYRGAPAATVIFSDGGVVTNNDIRRLLREPVGPINVLEFNPVVNGKARNVIQWTALTDAPEVVSGQLAPIRQ